MYWAFNFENFEIINFILIFKLLKQKLKKGKQANFYP